MPKKKVKKPPVGRCTVPPIVLHDPAFLAEQIDAVATLMLALAERMEYFGGFNGEMVKHSREMTGGINNRSRLGQSDQRAEPPGVHRMAHGQEKESRI